jgi:hypothetical protein
MISEKSLWTEVADQLRHHKGGMWTGVLNRQFAERIAEEGVPGVTAPELTEAACTIAKQTWLQDRLSRLIMKKNVTKSTPAVENLPIVVVSYHGKDYLIDGHNRVNKWRKENDRRTHNVIVIMPRTNSR